MPDSLVAPEWEMIDPTPDPIALFMQYNKQFFWGKLDSVTVSWSPRMTTCAGICCYEGRGGLCSIRLSKPLLQLRPRKDLVETLLHEMIHAYLFVTQNNRDRDGHGPEFQKHMHRINTAAKTNITIYHSFHDEVRHYKTHIWKCSGPCKDRKPYYGLVKRASNRAPGPNDLWWKDHQASCGGKFHKISEPEEFTKKQENKKLREEAKKKKDEQKRRSQITNFFPTNTSPAKSKTVSNDGAKVKKPAAATITGVIKSPDSNNSGVSTPNRPNKPSGKIRFTGVNILGGRKHEDSLGGSGTPLVRKLPGFGELPVRVPSVSTAAADFIESQTGKPSTASTADFNSAHTTAIVGSSVLTPGPADRVITISSDSDDDMMLCTPSGTNTDKNHKKRKRLPSSTDSNSEKIKSPNLNSHLIDSDEELDEILTKLKEKNSRLNKSCAKSSTEQRENNSGPNSKQVKNHTNTGGSNSPTTSNQVLLNTDSKLCDCPVCGKSVAMDLINMHMDYECVLVL